MGYKTITFSNDVEKRTYVQGEFTGKYYGTINDKMLSSKTELYDIQIYEGDISNLKNDREHPEIINDIVYNAITSETQLTQKSFENVLVKLNTSISDFDSITLDIREPKLEAVQIYDVVKDGNNTFGTLTCLVSGFLLEIETKYDTIEVKTCDNCKQVLEECRCKKITATVINEEKVKEEVLVFEKLVEETYWESISKPFSKENRRKLWNDTVNTAPGCIGAIGLLFGLLFLVSFGMPGILTGLLLTLFYVIGAFFSFFPSLPYHWRQLFYVFIGILLLGMFLNLFKQPWSYNSLRNDLHKVSENVKGGFKKIHNNPATPKPQTGSKTSYPEPTNSKNDSPDIPYSNANLEEDSSLLLKERGKRPLEQTITLYKDSIHNLYGDSTEVIQNQMQSSLSTISSVSPEDLLDTILPNSKPSPQILDISLAPNQQNTTPLNENITTIDTTKIQTRKNGEKVKRIPQIMSSIVFEEGDIYVCKDDKSKYYHLDQNCKALEDCTNTIYQTNIPVAERDGRILCELEK